MGTQSGFCANLHTGVVGLQLSAFLEQLVEVHNPYQLTGVHVCTILLLYPVSAW